MVAQRQLGAGLGKEAVGRRDLGRCRRRHVGVHGDGNVFDERRGQIGIRSHLDLEIGCRLYFLEARIRG